MAQDQRADRRCPGLDNHCQIAEAVDAEDVGHAGEAVLHRREGVREDGAGDAEAVVDEIEEARRREEDKRRKENTRRASARSYSPFEV